MKTFFTASIFFFKDFFFSSQVGVKKIVILHSKLNSEQNKKYDLPPVMRAWHRDEAPAIWSSHRPMHLADWTLERLL